jgi:hypothetical protein
MRRIGPNSPTAPEARRYLPKRVWSSPASRRIGIRVPIAVVARAEPGVEERHHDAERRQQAADSQRDGERHCPGDHP